MPNEARTIEMAVRETLESEADCDLGLKTADTVGSATTVEVGDGICLALRDKWASFTPLAGNLE